MKYKKIYYSMFTSSSFLIWVFLRVAFALHPISQEILECAIFLKRRPTSLIARVIFTSNLNSMCVEGSKIEIWKLDLGELYLIYSWFSFKTIRSIDRLFEKVPKGGDRYIVPLSLDIRIWTFWRKLQINFKFYETFRRYITIYEVPTIYDASSFFNFDLIFPRYTMLSNQADILWRLRLFKLLSLCDRLTGPHGM